MCGPRNDSVKLNTPFNSSLMALSRGVTIQGDLSSEPSQPTPARLAKQHRLLFRWILSRQHGICHEKPTRPRRPIRNRAHMPACVLVEATRHRLAFCSQPAISADTCPCQSLFRGTSQAKNFARFRQYLDENLGCVTANRFIAVESLGAVASPAVSPIAVDQDGFTVPDIVSRLPTSSRDPLHPNTPRR